MAIIKDEWVDVDHTNDGMLESDESFAAIGVQEFNADWLIPRSDWRDWIAKNDANDDWVDRHSRCLNDQGRPTGESSCVSNSTEACIRALTEYAIGSALTIKCSPMSLYVRVCSSRHSGSSMQGNLSEVMRNGILPEDTPANKEIFRHTFRQNGPYPGRGEGVLPDGWKDTARHFRIFEFFQINSRDEFASAVLRGWPVSYGRSGHCIAAMRLVYENGRFLIKYADSYSEDRGDNGYLYDSESKWSTGGAWCGRVTRLPDDPKNPAGADQIKQR